MLVDDQGNRDSISNELAGQLRRYDPNSIRRVSSLPNPPAPPAITPPLRPDYVVVGQGSASGHPCQHQPLSTPLRLVIRSLPAGPTFCFVGVFRKEGERKGRASLDGACESLSDAARGYGMVQAQLIGGPFLEGLVPDRVAVVLLHYRSHQTIKAHLGSNAFWAKVPRLPPSEPDLHILNRSKLRRAVLRGLPETVIWQSRSGQRLRAFRPPPSYVKLLMRRYRACVITDCGR